VRELSARDRPQRRAVKSYENYYKAQGLWGIPKKGDIQYSQELDLDLNSVVPSVAGRNVRRTKSNCRT